MDIIIIILTIISTYILSEVVDILTAFKIAKTCADNGYKYNFDSLKKASSCMEKEIMIYKFIGYIPIANVIASLIRNIDIINKINGMFLVDSINATGLLDKMDNLELDTYKKNPTGVTAISIEKLTDLRRERMYELKIKSSGKVGKAIFEIEDNIINIIKVVDVNIVLNNGIKMPDENVCDLIIDLIKQTMSVVYNAIPKSSQKAALIAVLEDIVVDIDEVLEKTKEEVKEVNIKEDLNDIKMYLENDKNMSLQSLDIEKRQSLK